MREDVKSNLYIVNPSIEMRRFNWKRPIERRQTFGVDFIFNSLHDFYAIYTNI